MAGRVKGIMAATEYALDGRLQGVSQRYLSGAENLRLTVFNSAANVRVAITGRRLACGATALSEFRQELVPTTNRAATPFDFNPGEGWLLGLAVRTIAGSPIDGQTYAVVEIGIGSGSTFQALDVLCADYVTAAHRISWPGTPVRGPLESAGALRAISGSTPAAGAEISETVPTGARWELLAFTAKLTTNATVANRGPLLILDDGATAFAALPIQVNDTAGTIWINTWAQGVTQQVANVIGVITSPLPVGVKLAAGHRIRTSTTNIQGTDTWTLVDYLVREWLEGA